MRKIGENYVKPPTQLDPHVPTTHQPSVGFDYASVYKLVTNPETSGSFLCLPGLTDKDNLAQIITNSWTLNPHCSQCGQHGHHLGACQKWPPLTCSEEIPELVAPPAPPSHWSLDQGRHSDPNWANPEWGLSLNFLSAQRLSRDCGPTHMEKQKKPQYRREESRFAQRCRDQRASGPGT